MTLTELRYIITLGQEKHFGRAALACHVSQPTLSVAINKIEQELNIAIFERDRHHVRITPLGIKIIEQAQRILDEANKLRTLAEEGRCELKVPLKVGAIYTIGPYLFPSLIPELGKIAPEMPLFIQEDLTANLRQKLLQGTLDAIFVALPFADKNIVTKPLYDEAFVMLMRKDHRLSKNESIKASDLKPNEMLLLGEGHCLRNQVLAICPQCSATDGNTMSEGASLETLRHMVASGLGVTVLPHTATQIDLYQSTLCTKPFAGDNPKRTVVLAWRTSFTRTKAIDALIAALHATQLQGAQLSINLMP